MDKVEDNKPGETRFKYELDNVLGTIADDMAKLNNGEAESNLKILNLDERIYCRLMNFLKPQGEPAHTKPVKKSDEPEAPVKRLNIQDSVLAKTGKK